MVKITDKLFENNVILTLNLTKEQLELIKNEIPRNVILSII